MVVIGIMTLFQGLVAICINKTGPIVYRPSLLEDRTVGECYVGKNSGLLVSYWLSGTISNDNGCRVAWNIAQNNGKVYCWSVPCRNAESRHQLRVEENVRVMCGCQVRHVIVILNASFIQTGRSIQLTRTGEALHFG